MKQYDTVALNQTLLIRSNWSMPKGTLGVIMDFDEDWDPRVRFHGCNKTVAVSRSIVDVIDSKLEFENGQIL